MEDPSTLARILAEGDSDHATEGHRLFCDGAVVDGRWQVLALLGKGGNGEVYRVCDIKAGTIGALKVPCAEENNLRRRFDRELEILQQIATWPLSEASRHFPRIIDRGMVAEKGVPYFVIEFLQPLKVPKKSPTVRKLILEVCEAVRQLHKNGYLHRDIKLANLMQRENGDIVLIDFGLVGRIEDFENPLAERVSMTQGGRMMGVGTEGSTAPEQLCGHASVKSDIYAIATVAVDCFGGEPPRKWIPIIQKAHNPKPEHRFEGIDDFVTAVKRDVPEREWRSNIRLLAIVLSAAVVCSMLAYYYVQRKTSDGNNPKQGQETWEEFVSRRVQEDRPEIEESLKELRAHMAELKREAEDRKHEDVPEGITASRTSVPPPSAAGGEMLALSSVRGSVSASNSCMNSGRKSIEQSKVHPSSTQALRVVDKSKKYKSLSDLRVDANNGSSWAKFLLGVALVKGSYGEQDVRVGLHCLEEAVQEGETNACFYLGQAYEKEWVDEGFVIRPNIDKAIAYYRHGMETSNLTVHAACCYRLGIIYANDRDVEHVDWTNAVNCLERVRDREEFAEDACRTLGMIYQRGGFGIKADSDKAEERFVLAMSMARESRHRKVTSGQFSIGGDTFERFKAKAIRGVEFPALERNQLFWGTREKIIGGVKYTYSIAILDERIVPPTVKRVGALSIRHIEFDASVKRITLPDEIDGISVAVVWPGCIQNGGELKELCLSKNNVYVDELAFKGCPNLKIIYK